MRFYYPLLFLVSLFTQTFAQTDSASSKILSKEETSQFFNDAFKKKYPINFPIFRAYTYTDKSGTYYVALTESADTVNKEKDTVNFTIKALSFKVDKEPILKKWEINDFRLPIVKGVSPESSIWFWTKYCEFKDTDGDGLIEPIIVYGTFGDNGYDDGRAKIILFYKGQKVAIRHQNSVLDGGRKTQVDLLFYSLPGKLQEHVREIMTKMVEKKHAVFPSAYVEKMNKKVTQISNE